MDGMPREQYQLSKYWLWATSHLASWKTGAMMSSMYVYNLYPRSPVVLPVTNAGLLHVELISS